MLTSLRRGGVAAILASVPLAAQTPDTADAGTALRAALAKTSQLGSIAFKTVESQDDALRRRLPFAGESEDMRVTGTVADGVLVATIGFDDDQIVAAKGRMIARQGDGEWKLRRGFLADGRSLPFVADPQLLLEALCSLPEKVLKVTHVESTGIASGGGDKLATDASADATKDQGTQLRTYSFTVSGTTADDLGLAGALPRSGGGHMLMIFGGGGGQVSPPRPEVTLDVAVTVDVATGHVVRVRSKSYAKSALPGNVQMRFAGADGVEIAGDEEEEEKDDEPADKDGPLTFSKGLPKRRVGKDISLTEFDVTLSKHGAAPTPEISDSARKLLGLR